MTFTVEFEGTVSSPARSGCGSSSAGCSTGRADAQLNFHFNPTIAEFERVEIAEYFRTFATNWVPLALANQFTSVGFIAMSLGEGAAPVEVLVGAPPLLLGSGGVFPTGFVGGEALTFIITQDVGAAVAALTRVTVSVTFAAGDQTAVQVAARINAAAALVGLSTVATVVGGQIQLVGDLPGATEGLQITAGNATVGLVISSRRGTGDAQFVSRNWLLETIAIPGANFWVRGGAATISLLVAGT